MFTTQVGKLTDKFFKRGTGTSESYKDISTQPFPVLTICPSYPYKDDRIKFHGLDLKKDLQARNLKYRDRLKGLYVVARNFFLLLLKFSAWPCLAVA